MSLSELVSQLDTGQSLSDLASEVRASETVRDGLASSGAVLAYLASINKYSVIESVAEDSAHPLQGAAKVALITLKTREGFDFSLTATLTLLSAFVSAGLLSQSEADAIQAMGQSTVKEFANVRDIDVKRVR